MLLLAIVTNLPEVAITVTAALSHHLGIAIGNILGGIAIQTVVLVALDGFGVPDKPLSYYAADLVIVLEGALVIGILGITVMATQLASVRLGDYKLAFSDIFGGNAFLPVLVLPASILSGGTVLPYAHNTDIYLTSLGIVLTMVYLWGLIFRPQRQFLRLGPDSLAVLVLYAIGTVGLVAIARG